MGAKPAVADLAPVRLREAVGHRRPYALVPGVSRCASASRSCVAHPHEFGIRGSRRRTFLLFRACPVASLSALGTCLMPIIRS